MMECSVNRYFLMWGILKIECIKKKQVITLKQTNFFAQANANVIITL